MDERCPDCGVSIALVGRRHNCRPVNSPDGLREAAVHREMSSPQEVRTRSRRRGALVESEVPQGSRVSPVSKHNQVGVVAVDCPVCAARREAKRIAQAKWRAGK